MIYTSKKGTKINIPDGLTAKQIASIKADADAGYGTRAQATANKLGKKVSGTTASGGSVAVDNSKIVDPGTGAIDVPGALGAVRKAGDQVITDQYGNKRRIKTNPDTGEVEVIDEAGGTANKFKTLAEAAASTFNGDVSRQHAYDAEFANRTKYLDRNQARDIEASQQELANRGIPYDPAAANDPNTNNLYGRTIGGIKQNYAGQYSDAANQATLAGNQAYQVDSNARDSFLTAVTNGAQTFGGQFQPYQSTSGEDTQNILGLSVKQIMDKYGIDEATATQKYLANKQKSGGGGSGGGASAGGFDLA